MASDDRSLYPYVSDKDWSNHKDDPAKLEEVNGVRKRDLKDKFANFSLSENKLNVEIPPQTNARNGLRLVIIGKTGQGKSATANTILGKVRFEEDYTASSVTRESRCFTEVVDERKISVMDTPGLQDTHQSNENILKELAQMTKFFPDGVHAFLYVMNLANPRFTAEDKNVLDSIEETFGGGFKNYCLLVYSHGDSELIDVDLDTYRNKQMAIGQATRGNPTTQNGKKDHNGQDLDKDQEHYQDHYQDHDQDHDQDKDQEQDQDHDQEKDHKSLAILLDELSWKMLAIDNKTSVPFEKAYYRKQIVAMVDRMITLNSPQIYTNDMFVKAQQEKKDMRRKGHMNRWHPSIMSKVETIITANPDISTEQLQLEIDKQFEKESENKMMALKKKEEEFEKERIAAEGHLEEQKSLNEEKRQAEEKERRERQERKERFEGEEQEKRKRQELEWKQFELRQTQEKEERLRDVEEFERLRQEQLKREELEREEKWKREDMERERRWEREQEEREKAERERRQQADEVLQRLRQDIEILERLKKQAESNTDEIEREHRRIWKRIFSGCVSIAKNVFGWFIET